MNSVEILEHAIGKAKFSIEDEFHLPQAMSASDDMVQITSGFDLLTNELGYFVRRGRISSFIPYQRIVFSHSFAKALFGEEKICKDGTTYDRYLERCADAGMTKEEAEYDWEVDEENVTQSFWQYHLQKMVICEEPLKYLEGFLK